MVSTDAHTMSAVHACCRFRSSGPTCCSATNASARRSYAGGRGNETSHLPATGTVERRPFLDRVCSARGTAAAAAFAAGGDPETRGASLGVSAAD